MKTLARYLELIADPSFDDFHRNPRSVRYGYLACVAIYHAVDRMAEEQGKRAAHFRQIWTKESTDFYVVDIIAHHLKHVQSNEEEIQPGTERIPIGTILGFGEDGEGLELRHLYYLMRDALIFVHKKAGTEFPRFPLPTN